MNIFLWPSTREKEIEDNVYKNKKHTFKFIGYILLNSNIFY
jgi:hypothetical protein